MRTKEGSQWMLVILFHKCHFDNVDGDVYDGKALLYIIKACLKSQTCETPLSHFYHIYLAIRPRVSFSKIT